MSKPVLSLEAFADWCEKQGDREYDYLDPGNCAVAQYAVFLGMKDQWLAYRNPFWHEANTIAGDFDGDYGQDEVLDTFSGLAARLRSAS